MKKFLSIILATALMFSILAVPSFATDDRLTTNGDFGTYEYYVSTDLITVEGWTDFELNIGRSVSFGVEIWNYEEAEIIYEAEMQCAVDYVDGTQDFLWSEDSVAIRCNDDGEVYDVMYLSFDNTAISIDAEFHVYSSGFEKWFGSIARTYTHGIDL